MSRLTIQNKHGTYDASFILNGGEGESESTLLELILELQRQVATKLTMADTDGIYAIQDGDQIILTFDEIVSRETTGGITVNLVPQSDNEATSKSYVDEQDEALGERISAIEDKEEEWDGKSDFSGNWSDIVGKPTNIYLKPSTGIPVTDMTTTVQNKINNCVVQTDLVNYQPRIRYGASLPSTGVAGDIFIKVGTT